MIRFLLMPIKFFLIFFFIFCFLILGSIITIFVSDKWKRKKALNRLVSFACRLGILTINVKTVVKGTPPPTDNYLFVSNHQTYLDVLVMTALRPGSFVTSLDIKRMPLLGQMCTLAGCLFVDRKSRVNLPKEIEELTEGLTQGLDVTIFPEATSTDGSTIIRFRRPLFTAAVLAQKKVLPMMIRYKSISGTPVDASNRDVVCWYGDMTFIGSLVVLLSQSVIEVELTYFDPVETKGKENFELAESTHALLLKNYVPY